MLRKCIKEAVLIVFLCLVYRCGLASLSRLRKVVWIWFRHMCSGIFTSLLKDRYKLWINELIIDYAWCMFDLICYILWVISVQLWRKLWLGEICEDDWREWFVGDPKARTLHWGRMEYGVRTLVCVIKWNTRLNN